MWIVLLIRNLPDIVHVLIVHFICCMDSIHTESASVSGLGLELSWGKVTLSAQLSVFRCVYKIVNRDTV